MRNQVTGITGVGGVSESVTSSGALSLGGRTSFLARDERL
jgi:hypothetical protein